VWTPKRILLLAGGFLLFTLIYFAYSLTSLGRINTLPPLPDQYKLSGNGASSGDIVRPPNAGPTPLVKKMEQAFNPGCQELKWPVQLELNSKNMVLAAIQCDRTDDGRIKLSPMSLALFGKDKHDGRGIEINVLKCDCAYIKFDRRINALTPNEMNGRKIVEAQLWGVPGGKTICITNNRRTPSTEDDLVVTINTGPLYYIEKTQSVRTKDHVRIVDGKHTFRNGRLIPPKAVIDANGMEMELTTSAPPPRPGLYAASKPRNDSISGVKRIVLNEDVTMILRVGGGTPFPGNDKAANRATAPVADPKKTEEESSLLRIVSPGRFDYKLFKDHDEAVFDVPTEGELLNRPQDVTVERLNGDQIGNDMLVCKHLELRLKRRSTDTPPAGKTTTTEDEQGVEIETAHATGRYVILTSDAEKLDAHGNDFFHDAAKKLTVLKGTPYMEANKEDNLIQAPTLTIQDIPVVAGGDKATKATKTYQHVQASGPGSIHILNKSTNKRSSHAYWNESLVSTRDVAVNLDLLVLTGSARFVDEDQKQALQGEELRVWLLADDKNDKKDDKKDDQKDDQKSAGSGESKTAASSRRPHHIEALRNVFAQSKEMNVHDAARLYVRFVDVPPDRMPPTNDKPAPHSGATKSMPVATKPPALTPSATANPQAAVPRLAAKPQAPPSVTTKPQTDPLPRPIDLSASSIEVRVLRCDEQMTLDHLWADGGASEHLHKRGGVRVRQEPGQAGQDGVDIEANTLNMACTANGNILNVTGDLACLEMGKIKILGPDVNIDQAANKVWVIGGGAMRMQSNTTLENKPLKEPVPLTIHWNDRMFFSGSFAEFHGGIQADQGTARLACQNLQVMFDRPISLKHDMGGERSAKSGKPGDEETRPAKVSKLVGDEEVRAEDQTLERGQLEKYQLLLGSSITMTTVSPDEESPPADGKANDANELKLTGPGSVRILQRGGSDLGSMPDSPTPNRPAAKTAQGSQELKLTYIRFEKLMQANNLTNVASFWESVRALNMPCNDPHCEIDLDAMLATQLPPGAMYLRCNHLKVATIKKSIPEGENAEQRKDGDKQAKVRTYQLMEAHGQVIVQSQEFTAQCDLMTFNEEKDQVIFHGERGNEAVLSKVTVKGGQPMVYRGKKIIYYRSTGRVDGIDLKLIRG
jgi:lipopolysaccharide export system protein LptA